MAKKTEKMEFYCVKPNLKQSFGRKITKELEFDEYTEDKSIHQTLKDCVFTTEIDKTYKQGDYEIEEHSKTSVKCPEGTILIWNEEMGYVIPSVEVCTLNDVENDINLFKDIYGGKE
jgi:hypothetical protein